MGEFQDRKLSHCWEVMLCRVVQEVDSERIGDMYNATELSGKAKTRKFLALIFCLFEKN